MFPCDINEHRCRRWSDVGLLFALTKPETERYIPSHVTERKVGRNWSRKIFRSSSRNDGCYTWFYEGRKGLSSKKVAGAVLRKRWWKEVLCTTQMVQQAAVLIQVSFIGYPTRCMCAVIGFRKAAFNVVLYQDHPRMDDPNT